MRIRQAQIRQLERAKVGAVEAVLEQHFRDQMPARVRVLDEAQLREGIRVGIERAADYGLSVRATAQFITWMFLLGSDFDRDPALGRLTPLLREPPHWSPEQRCEHFSEQALAFLDLAEGPDNEYLDAALARVRNTPFEALLPDRDQPAEDYVVERLCVAHPERCAAVGNDALRQLCQHGTGRAETLGLRDSRSLALYCGVMLLAGSGFETDPLLPWGRTLLSGARARPPAGQAERLHSSIVALVTALTGG